MKERMKKMAGVAKGLCVMAMAFLPLVATSGAVFADSCGDVETSILPGNWGIGDILKLVLNVIVYGLGAAAVLGVIIAGIMYMTARDNEAQVTKAKTRLYEIVIGLVAWAVMYAVLNWLIPGGLNLDVPNECSTTSAVVEILG